MTSHDLLAAMHAVLDGEATDDETRALERRLRVARQLRRLC